MLRVSKLADYGIVLMAYMAGDTDRQPVTARQLSMQGVALAALSGVFASGLGYVIWYAAMPRLTRIRAATVQLSVPVIVAVMAVILLGEPMTVRVLIAGCLTLGGIALAITQRG